MRLTIHQLLMFAPCLASASARFQFRPLARCLRAPLIVPLLLLALLPSAQAQYTWDINDDGTVAIRTYTGSGGAVTIPGIIDGRPVAVIGFGAFEDSGLTRVTIPDSVRHIAWRAFSGCVYLTSVFIGSGVTNINRTGEFGGAGEPGSFLGCLGLTNFSVDPLNPAYSGLDGALLNKTQDSLLIYPAAKGGSYLVPDRVTTIEKWAFSGCAGLTNVWIPGSVTNISFFAFEECRGLTNLTIPSSVTRIGDSPFTGCSGLKSVFFAGNAPLALGGPGSPYLIADTNTTVYYLPGTTGWGESFGGCPAVLWNPTIHVGKAGVGQTSILGVTIVGTPNIPFVLEAPVNLAAGPWTPLQTGTLTNGLISFSDPEWTNYPSRFYRIRSP